jgi:hypothetical protein
MTWMASREYLLCYGKAGDFGRFEADQPLSCRRGQRLVIRSDRGDEIGVVMRAASAGHEALLAGRQVGRILRIAEGADLDLAEHLQQRSESLFREARHLAARHALPLEVLDAEILFDGRQGVLYCLKPRDLQLEGVLETLARDSGLTVTIRDLATPIEERGEEGQPAGEGCGAPGCGHGALGCGSCSSGACSSCALHQAISTPARRTHPRTG